MVKLIHRFPYLSNSYWYSSRWGTIRSADLLFGQLIPANRANEFFGFYNIFGKFSSILGTTLLGITAQMTGNSLDGVFSLIILFLIGSVLLFFVKLPTQKGLENEG